MKAKEIKGNIKKKYDITKFINFRNISYEKIDDDDIIFAMAFAYRFTEEEVIKDFKKELYITVNPLTNEEIITNLKNIVF